MAPAALTSAAGVVALLHEPENALKVHALRSLDALVHLHWSEIASSIGKIEELSEDTEFSHRSLAALVASKLFYHLEEMDDALRYALSAGSLFDIASQSEYTETLIAKCIDEYIRLRVENAENIDARLVDVVERMFTRCFEDNQLKQALGIALETHCLDKVRECISRSADQASMLAHCFSLALTVIKSRQFRQEVMRELSVMYLKQEVPDHISVCQCLLYLDDANGVARVLHDLLQSNKDDDVLMSYQVAYELAENENQPFLLRVSNALPKAKDETAMETTPDSSADEVCSVRLNRLRFILSGKSAIALFTQFLYTHNHTDLGILKNIKEKIDNRNSVTHCAAIICHAFMQSGTTRDHFIRDNLDWLARASNFAKLSVTASFGVIHRCNVEQSMRILQPYLPAEGVNNSPYLVGGALYGLGLIHANGGGDKREYLMNALANAGDDEVVQHGACFGLGLNSMATWDSDLYSTLKNVLFHDNAVAGEAAGLAMGLVLLGSGSESASAIEEMLAYAQDTNHEKIIRGLALGLACIMSGREEQSDVLVEQLLKDKDPNLRYGACYTLALAFSATANNSAVRRLLHVAVSDVSVDVRRAAVTALGFVLCNVPERVPRVVSLLSESYSPHVRYGAAMAVGIGCAGTGLKAAIEMLQPMCKDRVDYVRQGAMLALSMVLIQMNSQQEPAVDTFRAHLKTVVEAKHSDTMTKFGAVLASGILDAGGRNVTIALRSPAGHRRTAAIVGMAFFTQYWYWFPLVHFVSLSFAPSAVIGLNHELKIPRNFKFRSNAKPSLFAYPPIVEEEKQEEVKKVPTAQLSISAKAKAKAAKKKKDREEDEEGEVASTTAAAATTMDVDSEEKKADDAAADADADKTADEEEPAFELLCNPVRVTPLQRRHVQVEDGERYVPVKKSLYGVVLLKDTRPDEPEDLIVAEAPKALGVGEEEEAAPPQPFEFSR